jgi:hypothetical protein
MGNSELYGFRQTLPGQWPTSVTTTAEYPREDFASLFNESRSGLTLEWETVSEPGAAIEVKRGIRTDSPARRVLRTYELAPATPWYVWASVALAFIILMAWLAG